MGHPHPSVYKLPRYISNQMHSQQFKALSTRETSQQNHLHLIQSLMILLGAYNSGYMKKENHFQIQM
jgi:hypothetical protein